jgi:TolB-like protein/Flp pilus assembly protein TadD
VTIAVLPFETTGGNPADQDLADELGEDTIASLDQIDPQHVTVVARTSVLPYRGGGRSRAEIGRDLGVHYFTETQVAADGGYVWVTSRLIRASDMSQVWTATYSRERSRVRAIQRELSAAIAEHARVDVVPDHLTGLDRRQTRNPDAYEAYLRARYFENQRNRESTARAVQYYEQAVTLDPQYALAWSGLSFTLAASAINSDADPQEVWPRARTAAENALRANPDLAEAQFADGYVQWLFEWDWPRAESAFKRAITLDSSHVTAHRTLGHVLSQMGAHREAEQVMAHTRSLEPLSPMSHALSAQIAFQARDNTAATRHAKRATLVDSQFWIGHMQLAQAYAHGGETDLALESLADAARFSGGENSKTLSLRGYVMGRLGRRVEAEEALRALATASATRYVPPYASALVHAGLGNSTAVFEWLDRAFMMRDVNLIFLAGDPKWDPYRQDPRFSSLVKRCGFAQVKE